MECQALTNQRTPAGRADVTDTKGLYWILDEESMFPGATDITFLERVLMHHSDAGRYTAPMSDEVYLTAKKPYKIYR